jgi:broad specificity phosphatase PhoE
MNAKTLFFARHGETDYNKNKLLQGRGINASLNQNGLIQAELLAGYLSRYPLECIISSSLKRSYETAELLANRINIDILQKSDLDEMDFGDFEGATFSEVGKELKYFQREWANGKTDLKLPGGESPRDVYLRVSSCINSIINENGQTYYAFIVHGRLIRIILSEWLGYGLNNMQRINHSNGGVNKLVTNGSKYICVSYLNKTDHLKAEAAGNPE